MNVAAVRMLVHERGHSVLWLATLAVVVAVVVLLRDILLPFVAGIALAYLLDPVVERIERLGVNRTIATLGIVGLFIIGVGGVMCRSRLSLARSISV
jgi:predicted PurR-regulated permease PerM